MCVGGGIERDEVGMDNKKKEPEIDEIQPRQLQSSL